MKKENTVSIYTIPQQSDMVTPAHRVIAVGVFDGVHIGHRAVLTKALTVYPYTPAVFTFCTNQHFKSSGALQTDEQRRAELEMLGFTDIFEAEFSAVRDWAPETFVDFLHTKLGAQAIVCGFNFRFGKNGVGDTALLQSLCDAAGIQLFVVPAVLCDGLTVSSTRIKQALLDGDTETYTRLTCKPYTISQAVIDGQQLGRHLGAPTINQVLTPTNTLPRFGVYASVVLVNNEVKTGVTNIGIRPTVGGKQPLAETYILDFEGDLYGQTITVQLIHFLRPEQKFADLQQLQQQISKDANDTANFFAAQNTARPRAVIFDFDNTLQDRDIAFTGFCKEWLQQVFPTMSQTDKTAIAAQLCAIGNHGFLPYRAVLDATRKVFPDTELDADLFFQMLTVFYPVHTSLFPDTAAVLQTLRDKGYRLGVLTNGNSRIQNAKLDVSGLRPLFDYVMVAGDEQLQKPEAEAFRRAALRLGVHPQDCVYVGDNPKNDIAGAKAAGMRAVFRDFNFDGVTVKDEDVVHIHSLTDLLNIL